VTPGHRYPRLIERIGKNFLGGNIFSIRAPLNQSLVFGIEPNLIVQGIDARSRCQFGWFHWGGWAYQYRRARSPLPPMEDSRGVIPNEPTQPPNELLQQTANHISILYPGLFRLPRPFAGKIDDLRDLEPARLNIIRSFGDLGYLRPAPV
jgi:hypothetical protein